jgi:STE24 endopeptidase
MSGIQLNSLFTVFLSIYVLQSFFVVWLESLNRKHLEQKGNRIPQGFEGFIDQAKLRKITAYTREQSRIGIIEHVASDVILLVVILSGFLPHLARLLSDAWHLPYILSGLLFFMTPGVILYLAGLPFDYYDTFVIEEKYGFNRSTLKLWITDHIKSGLISIILSSILLSLILWMIDISPGYWWLWGFFIVSFVQILLAVLYPVLIAPLFNKFTPVRDQDLAGKIKSLMERGGIKVKTILQMDAGERSRHTNAYFTGIGRTKRIVLFDTLLESHPHDEILGVLAHEVGHFRGRHVIKQIVFFEIAMLLGFYFTYRVMGWPVLYETFGFTTPLPYVGLFLVGILWQKLGFLFKPFYMAISRRYERQADAFSVRLLKTAEPMIVSLKRLASDNLANLTPHPLYVWFNYSHPPLVERVAFLAEAARLENASGRDQEIM